MNARDSPWYIVLLLAIIGGAMGYVYATSEVSTVVVEGKRIEEARGRRGLPAERFVIETDRGDLPILKFPVIGYAFGAEEVYAGIQPGSTIRIRAGKWPPGSRNARQHIMTVY